MPAAPWFPITPSKSRGPRMIRPIPGTARRAPARALASLPARFAAWLPVLASAGDFRLEIPSVPPGSTLGMAQVYDGASCHGGNTSPALQWRGAPAGTRSFAVTIFDPDAPTGHGWWHWVVYDIPAQVGALPEHAGDADGRRLPAGAAQARSDFGTTGFGGACPPPGAPHRYVFTVYALDVEHLGAAPGTGATAVDKLLDAHALDHASVTAHYGR